MNVRTVSRLHTQPLPPCRVKAVTRSLCSRRRCLIAFALDGPWAQQAYKGSNSSSSAPQEQLTSNPAPAPEPVSNEPLAPAASATASPNPASTSSSSQTTVSNSNSSASTPSSPAAASPGVTPSPTQQQQPSWESWCEHFDQQDQSGTKLDFLQPQLATAISDEDYQAAAAIKSEISSLTSADAVAAIQQRLAAALAAEQYAEAAVLRDQGWALLEGWWACETTDAAGHLLKVSPEYGRWTGKAYTPREVVEMQTWAREQRAARRLDSSSRRNSSSRRVGGVSDVDRSSQLGTPIMEVFVRQQQDEAAAAVEAGQELSSWESQAVVLQPAAASDQSAGAGAAARDADLEAEIGELFKSEVTRAVWGRSSLSDDTAAAAASGIALPGAPAGSSDAFAMSGSPFVKNDVMQSGDYSSGVTNPEQGMSNPASDYALVFGGQGSDHDREPWEELLDAAESALAAAAAAADQAGGVLCADGQIRRLNRQGLSAAAAAAADSAAAAAEAGNAQGLHDNARSEPVLQLLLEIVEGRDHVLLAARSVHGVTRSTSWTVCAMPSGPGMVPDWSLVTPDQVPEMRARLAASLEAQRVVREMQGARDGWWMNPYVENAVFNLTGPAAVAAMQRQQQGPNDNAQDEADVPKDESPPDEFGYAWDDVIVGNDAAMRSGFYAEFYQDFGPGVEFPWLGDRYHPDEQQRQQQLGPNDAFDFSVANSSSSSASSSSSKVISSPALADLAPAELEEVLETLEQLKNVTAASSSSSSSSDQQQQQQSSHIVWSPPATVDLQQHKEQQENTTRQQQQQRGLRRKAPGLASSSRPSSSRWPAAAAAWRSSRTAAGSSSDQMDGTAVAVDELERHPGVVGMQGIDRFTLKPQMQPGNSSSSSSSGAESSALSQQQQQQQGEASTNKVHSRSRKMPRRSIYVIEVPSKLVDAEDYKQQQQQQQQQHKAITTGWRVDGVEDKGYDRVWQLAAHQVLLQHACTPAAAEAAASDSLTSTVAASTNAAAAAAGSPLPITWRQPLADLMSSRSNEVLSGGSDLDLECNVADTLEEESSKTLEDEQETATASSSSSTASSGSSSSKVLCVPADAPVLVLQLPQRLVDQVDESAAAANAAAAARERAAAAVQKPGSSRKLERQTAAAAAAEPDGLKYRRINHKNATTTDPMTGLYVGAFGPHGPEIIQLYRSACEESGAETVVGLKLTGDANVPAGEVSFRAKIGRKHRLSTKGMFAPQLDIQARYPGEGRVAGPGFSNPRWVPGELLVFNSSSSSSGDDVINWTAGAQLGFVYDIPGQRRFCVLLNRISLE